MADYLMSDAPVAYHADGYLLMLEHALMPAFQYHGNELCCALGGYPVLALIADTAAQLYIFQHLFPIGVKKYLK